MITHSREKDRQKAPDIALLEEVLHKVLIGFLKWTCHKPVRVNPQPDFRLPGTLSP